MRSIHLRTVGILTDSQLKRVVNSMDQKQAQYVARRCRGNSLKGVKLAISRVLKDSQLRGIVKMLSDHQTNFLHRIARKNALGLTSKRTKLNRRPSRRRLLSRRRANFSDVGGGFAGIDEEYMGLGRRRSLLDMYHKRKNNEEEAEEEEAEEVREEAEAAEEAAEDVREKASDLEEKEEEEVKEDAEMEEMEKEEKKDQDMDEDMFIEEEGHMEEEKKMKNNSRRRNSLNRAVSDMARGMDNKLRGGVHQDSMTHYQNKARRLHSSAWKHSLADFQKLANKKSTGGL